MEQQLSDILDNLLGMLLLEGSYEIEEKDDSFSVSIETKDAGRLIGARGESLDALQLLINQMVSRKTQIGTHVASSGESENDNFKRIVVDVEGWRKQKEGELKINAESWGKQVLDSGQPLDLEPMAPWQRRIVHMTVSDMAGVESESIGEGRDRHIVIKLQSKNSKIKSKAKDVKTEKS